MWRFNPVVVVAIQSLTKGENQRVAMHMGLRVQRDSFLDPLQHDARYAYFLQKLRQLKYPCWFYRLHLNFLFSFFK